MSEAPDLHLLARQLVVLEESMNTTKAEYHMDIARLAAEMAERDAQLIDRIAGARWLQTAIFSGVIVGGLGICTAIILAAMGAL